MEQDEIFVNCILNGILETILPTPFEPIGFLQEIQMEAAFQMQVFMIESQITPLKLSTINSYQRNLGVLSALFTAGSIQAQNELSAIYDSPFYDLSSNLLMSPTFH